MRHTLISVMILANACSNDCASSSTCVTASAAMAPGVQPVVGTSTPHIELVAESIVSDISQYLSERALKHVPDAQAALEVLGCAWLARVTGKK